MVWFGHCQEVLWRKAEESNPHPFGVVTAFKTACRPRSETFLNHKKWRIGWDSNPRWLSRRIKSPLLRPLRAPIQLLYYILLFCYRSPSKGSLSSRLSREKWWSRGESNPSHGACKALSPPWNMRPHLVRDEGIEPSTHSV